MCIAVNDVINHLKTLQHCLFLMGRLVLSLSSRIDHHHLLSIAMFHSYARAICYDRPYYVRGEKTTKQDY